jgi:anaerobic selenocysteine-containing dehydrogenase
MEWAASVPESFAAMPFVLAKTIGKEWDSAALAGFWGVLMTAPKAFRKNAARIGFEPGMDQGDRIFQALLDTPEGIWVGEVDPDENFKAVKTPSGKIEVFVPELEEDAKNLNAENEANELKLPEEFPMILNAGRHTRYNINTLIRGQEWNKGKRACTVAVNPSDAKEMGLADGQKVTRHDRGRKRGRRTSGVRPDPKRHRADPPRVRPDLWRHGLRTQREQTYQKHA